MKKIIVFLLILVVLGIGAYSYIYKGHRNIATEEAFFSNNTVDFILEIETEGTLPVKYIDKTIQLSGKVTNYSNNEITLDEKLFFLFDNNLPQILKGDNITIKSRCVGFDDLLEQVKFDQSTLIK